MKTFHVTTISTWQKHLQAQSIMQSHYFVLSSGKVVVAIEFRSPSGEADFLADSDVLSLPHPLSGKPLGPEHAAPLSELGVKSGDSIYDAVKKLAAQQPLLRF